MANFSIEQLKSIYQFCPHARAVNFYPHLLAGMKEYGIVEPIEVAQFLAQIGHESGQLRYVLELASGEAYDTGRLAKALGNTADADGDGQRYKGRGLIQITGRANYAACSKALFGDESTLLSKPELLEQPQFAVLSACWYWNSRNIGKVADDLEKATRLINGGLNGLEDRSRLFARACEVFGVFAKNAGDTMQASASNKETKNKNAKLAAVSKKSAPT